MKTVVLTGVGKDRVGIVAELTQVLLDLGCNLLDSSMTLLSGQFALIVMAQLPDGVSVSALESKLRTVEKQLGMRVHVREMDEAELKEAISETNAFILSVYGADRPGIVARVTRALADAGINITDVQTKSTGAARKVFVMILEVCAPAHVSRGTVEQSLKAIAQQLDVDISVQALDVVEL